MYIDDHHFHNFAAARGVKHPINTDVDNNNRTLKASGRIAYGEVAYEGQFEFMARLAVCNSAVDSCFLNCGGTVIADMYILTAAHCMFDEDNDYYPSTHVLLGGTDGTYLDYFPVIIDVAEVYVHDQYRNDRYGRYDIAILKLETPTYYPAVALASSNPSAGTSLTSIGWGHTEYSDSVSDILLYTELEVGTFGSSPCPESCFSQCPCTLLCEVGIPKGSDAYTSACQGDSGGPQMLAGTNIQVGIVSFGPEGCGTDSWGVSTSVAELKSWIDGIIEPAPAPTPSFSPFQTIAHTSRYGTLLMTYDMCT